MPRYFKREGRGKGYEDVTREVAALRADLEQTTDERNALLHARTSGVPRMNIDRYFTLERDSVMFPKWVPDGMVDVTDEVAALRAERDALNEEANSLSREATRLGAELERVTTERDKALMAEAREGRIRLDAEAERDDAYALIRHYADTDPEVALAARMRPVVEAAKACADCDCESPRHDDDGNLFLPKGGYPCAWDCPHLEGLLDAVEAYRVATSEQERCECVPAVDEDGAPDGYEYVCNLHEKASEREASDHAG